MMNPLTELLSEIAADVEASDAEFASLYRPGLRYPIPFFGDITTARVITVGLNPSDGEFAAKRNWESGLSAEALDLRLRNYFTSTTPEPHGWFKPWHEALPYLGVAYQDGTAAHLDLSPRATMPASKARKEGPDPKLFDRMIDQDAKWLFRLLPHAPKCQLLALAGRVTTKHMGQFLEGVAPQHGYTLTGQALSGGPAYCALYQLTRGDAQLAVFYCSASPSSWHPEKLVQCIKEHSSKLRSFLK
jgi:hypothetical protein